MASKTLLELWEEKTEEYAHSFSGGDRHVTVIVVPVPYHDNTFYGLRCTEIAGNEHGIVVVPEWWTDPSARVPAWFKPLADGWREPHSLLPEDEGLTWIRGWPDEDSAEWRAAVVARSLLR